MIIEAVKVLSLESKKEILEKSKKPLYISKVSIYNIDDDSDHHRKRG